MLVKSARHRRPCVLRPLLTLACEEEEAELQCGLSRAVMGASVACMAREGRKGGGNARKNDQGLRRGCVHAGAIRLHYAVYVNRDDHVEAQFAETERGHEE